MYDRIELPPIKPDVTRGAGCSVAVAPRCGARATAMAPRGLEPGFSPFGQSIAALVIYLH